MFWCCISEGVPHPFTFGTHKAPADIDMGVVALPLHGSEVVGAHDAVGGNDGASRGNANVPGVVRDRTAHAAHHLPWQSTTLTGYLGTKLTCSEAQHCCVTLGQNWLVISAKKMGVLRHPIYARTKPQPLCFQRLHICNNTELIKVFRESYTQFKALWDFNYEHQGRPALP